jgi:DNA-binding MarR family transcriptional regulator
MISPKKHDTSKSDVDELAFLIADAARLMRSAFERRIARAGLGLTAGEARALIVIAETDGSRQLDIALRMGVEPMTLCAYLDKLQGLGLIERQQCCADRRAKRINLTAASAGMLTAIRKELNGIIGHGTEGMGEEQSRLLKAALGSFNARLQDSNLPASSQADIDEAR